MSYVNLEEVSECPFTSEDVLCSVMSKSNRRDQGRIRTSQILVLWSHPETPPSPESTCEQSSRNSKHSAGAHTQEVPHSAVSRDTVKSKLVPNLSTLGAYCYFCLLLLQKKSAPENINPTYHLLILFFSSLSGL